MSMPFSLTTDKFTPTVGSAGIKSEVLSYDVPLNSYLITKDDELMYFRLTSKQTYSYSSAQATADVTVAVNSRVATVGNLYTGTPNLDLSVLGYWTAGGTTTTVEATNVSGKNITFAVNDTTSTSATLTVYYTPKVGSYSWVVVAPTAASTTSQTVVTGSIGSANALNQSSTETGIYFPKKVLMTQRFVLQLWVMSSVAIDLAPNFETDTPNTLANISIPCYTGTMDELTAKDPNVAQTAVRLIQEGN